MPVNGDVDGQAGRLQEVGQQVPRDDPRLGDAHLNIMTQRFDLATSSWEDERDEQESLVGVFNIASRLLDLLLAVFPFLPHFLSKLVASPRRRVNQQKCRGQNCPTFHLSSLLGGYMIAKLTAWSNLFLASHEKLNWSLSCNLLSAIST